MDWRCFMPNYRRNTIKNDTEDQDTQKNLTVEIAVEVKHDTAKAMLVTDGSVEAWIPKSQVTYEPLNNNKETTITMPEWLAKNKGLI